MNKAIIDECYNWLNNNTQVNNKPTIKKGKIRNSRFR